MRYRSCEWPFIWPIVDSSSKGLLPDYGSYKQMYMDGFAILEKKLRAWVLLLGWYYNFICMQEGCQLPIRVFIYSYFFTMPNYLFTYSYINSINIFWWASVTCGYRYLSQKTCLLQAFRLIFHTFWLDTTWLHGLQVACRVHQKMVKSCRRARYSGYRYLCSHLGLYKYRNVQHM